MCIGDKIVLTKHQIAAQEHNRWTATAAAKSIG